MTRTIPAGKFPQFLTYLSIGIGPADDYVTIDKKGNPWITYNNAIMEAAFGYEQMAILARSRSKNLKDLVKNLQINIGMEDAFVNDMQKKARERLEKLGKQPTSFYMFILETELQHKGFKPFGSADMKDVKRATEVLTRNLPLQEVDPWIGMTQAEGIGFGSCFPDLTKQMYENYLLPKDEEWNQAKSFGVKCSSENPPQFPSFQEHEQNILKALATYVSERNPELLGPLDLHFTEYWTPGKPLYDLKSNQIPISNKETTDIKCPICGGKTSIRTAKKGPGAGQQFHVCEQYPECKGKIQILK